jgi:hypothetical protein
MPSQNQSKRQLHHLLSDCDIHSDRLIATLAWSNSATQAHTLGKNNQQPEKIQLAQSTPSQNQSKRQLYHLLSECDIHSDRLIATLAWSNSATAPRKLVVFQSKNMFLHFQFFV